MQQTKAWYHSRTVWGSMIVVAATLLSAGGVNIDQSAQAQMTEAMLQITGVGASLYAIYGRLKADSVIGMM